MSNRPNNPRAFAEVVSIDVWRTAYEGGSGAADLHIDVGFSTGRIGADDIRKSPVRFRMSLKRAEIYVIRDQGNIIEIPPSSLLRETPVLSRSNTTMTKSGSLKSSLKAAFSSKRAHFDVDAEAKASVEVTRRIEKDEEIGNMRIAHRKLPDNSGYVFSIEPTSSLILAGSVWDPSIPRMSICDTNSLRKRGDPPEVTVQIRCRREDLHIKDVTIVDTSVWNRGLLSRNKEIAVEQYIKKEILSMGLPCGDLSDDFATVILADAVSVKG